MRDELANAREALHLTRVQLARYGINAPAYLIMEERDLAKKVAQLEAALGLPPSEPRVLPDVPRRERYVSPPPARDYAAEREAQRQDERQRDIAHQTNLLAIHRRNLAILRAQARQLGAHAPFYIQAQMTDTKAEVARIKDVLRSFYGQAVDDLPGDA